MQHHPLFVTIASSATGQRCSPAKTSACREFRCFQRSCKGGQMYAARTFDLAPSPTGVPLYRSGTACQWRPGHDLLVCNTDFTA